MTTHDVGAPDALAALEELRRELSRLGWPCRLHADVPHPYLRVVDGHLTVEFVFTARHDEPAYRWSNVTREHPLSDPVGAARRISGDLTGRRPTVSDTLHAGR